MEGQEDEEEHKKSQPDVEDSRNKPLKGLDLIKEHVKELNEVIAYMDFSFERAFTIKEK